MNITGGMYDYAIFVSSSGAFSGTRTGNVYKLNEGLDHVDNKFFDGFSFNAANTWTGETSAVGGGASHTHGIKMTVRGVQSVVYRLNCLFYV